MAWQIMGFTEALLGSSWFSFSEHGAAVLHVSWFFPPSSFRFLAWIHVFGSLSILLAYMFESDFIIARILMRTAKTFSSTTQHRLKIVKSCQLFAKLVFLIVKMLTGTVDLGQFLQAQEGMRCHAIMYVPHRPSFEASKVCRSLHEQSAQTVGPGQDGADRFRSRVFHVRVDRLLFLCFKQLWDNMLCSRTKIRKERPGHLNPFT